MDDKELENVSGGTSFLTDVDVKKLTEKGYKVVCLGNEALDTGTAEYEVFDKNGYTVNVPHSAPDYTLRDAYLNK